MSTLDAEDDLDIVLDESDDGDFPFAGVGKALTRLREMTKSAQDQNIWSKKVVRQLWRSCVRAIQKDFAMCTYL
jgi:hypothetical protein